MSSTKIAPSGTDHGFLWSVALLLVALLTTPLHAASIRGTVSDSQTGRPLARALVVLVPVSGTPSPGASQRTDRFGRPDTDAMTAHATHPLKVDEASTLRQDLDLFIIR